MIIFDEVEFAKSIEKENINSIHNSFKKGVLLARLYLYNGLSEEETREKIEEKFSFLDNSYNYNIKYLKINKIMQQAIKSPQLISKSISFSKKELDFIHNFNNIRIEKIYFILFCMSKFYNNLFYFKDREVFNLADVPWNGQNSKNIFSYLIQNNYLNVEERGIANNRKIRKLFYSIPTSILEELKEEKQIIEITNYKNIIYYYLQYLNIGKYIVCKKCGCIESDTEKGRTKEFCNECGRIRALERKRKLWHDTTTEINSE